MSAADHLKTIRERAIRATPNGDDKHPGAYLADVFEMYDITRNTVPRLLDAVERVLAIHYPTDVGTDMQWCAECYVNDDPAEVEWPCPTYTAITTALEGKDA